MKRFNALFILSSVLFMLFAGCAETPDTGSSDISEIINNSTADELIVDEKYYDNLPDENYEGFSFNIYTRENTTHYKMLVTEQNGEVINDALFLRNSNVAERFNVVFNEDTYTDETRARTVIMAADDSYSIMNVRCSASNTLATENLVYGINQLPYVDLDKGYWDKELTEALSIGGKSYFAIGATNLSTYDFMAVMLFNKQLITDYGLESPYELVKDGKWTLDKFGELGAAVVSDLNGDGLMDTNDQFGLLGVSKFAQVSLLTSSDTMMIKLVGGYPVYEMYSDERFIAAFDKIFAVCTDNNSWYKTTDNSNEGTTYVNMFRENKGLFLCTIFYYIDILRDMETEFGIIPFPKFDEKQERYRNRISFYDTFVVPITATNLDRTSIIIEALTCESMNTVIPAYYDIALKTKYTRDDESQEMLDLIMVNRVLDLGDTVYVGLIRDSWLANMFVNNQRDIVSAASKNIKTIDSTLKKMIDLYNALEY
ncbi:MAG: hypothetical protein ACYCWE_18215 [Eubacteriales bacterium]